MIPSPRARTASQPKCKTPRTPPHPPLDRNARLIPHRLPPPPNAQRPLLLARNCAPPASWPGNNRFHHLISLSRFSAILAFIDSKGLEGSPFYRRIWLCNPQILVHRPCCVTWGGGGGGGDRSGVLSCSYESMILFLFQCKFVTKAWYCFLRRLSCCLGIPIPCYH
jgi:hypothetical protein